MSLPYRRLSDPPRNRRERLEDLFCDLAIKALLPIEKYHRWVLTRAYKKGKYVRPGTERAALTTKKGTP